MFGNIFLECIARVNAFIGDGTKETTGIGVPACAIRTRPLVYQILSVQSQQIQRFRN